MYFTTLFCLYLNICLAGIKVPIDMTGHIWKCLTYGSLHPPYFSFRDVYHSYTCNWRIQGKEGKSVSWKSGQNDLHLVPLVVSSILATLTKYWNRTRLVLLHFSVILALFDRNALICRNCPFWLLGFHFGKITKQPLWKLGTWCWINRFIWDLMEVISHFIWHEAHMNNT